MAGLPASKAQVWVGPPLSASGASLASIGLLAVPIRLPLASGEPRGAAVRLAPVLLPTRLLVSVMVG